MYTKDQYHVNIRRLLKYIVSRDTLIKINKLLIKDIERNYGIKENAYVEKKAWVNDGKFNAGRWNADNYE